jgi:ribosomal protein S18 acetylase RimI-like enzyme
LSPILLRPATDADTEALIDLKWEMNRVELASLPAGSRIAPMLDPSREGAARAVTARQAALARDGGAWWVATRDGAVIGSAFWTPTTMNPAFRETHARVALIGGVVVAEAARGQGIAKQLLARLETEIVAAGLTHAFLEVVASNTPALHLYRAIGYEDFEITMLKALTPGSTA